MEPITAVVLGAGSRGEIYAGYALRHPEELKVVAAAEPRPDRLAKLADAHGIPPENRFTSWEELRRLCGPKNQQTLLLSFDDYAAMILRDGRGAGFVIDPFGCCLSFDRAMVAHLVQRKAGQE